MKRRIAFVVTSCGLALAIMACVRERAPEVASASPDAVADGPADAPADARVPALPMPQMFPDVVWDAARATH